MRKKYLMMQDHSVIKTKQSLRQLIESGIVEKCERVLFPHESTSCSYIAVDGAYLTDLHMTMAEMTYQLRARKQLVYGEGGMPRAMRKHPIPKEADDTVYTYYPVTSYAEGLEEFYHMLMNIYTYAGVMFMQQGEVEDNDYVDFLDIVQCRIRLYDRGKLVKELAYSVGPSDIPFDIVGLEELTVKVAETFGCVTAYHGLALGSYTPLVVWKNENGTLRWNTPKRLDLTKEVYRVFLPSQSGFMCLTMEEYDHALAIAETRGFFHTIHSGVGLHPTPAEFNYLTFTAYHEIERWHVNLTDFETAQCYDLFAPNAIDMKAFTFYEAADALAMMELLPAMMKCLDEVYKGQRVNETEEPIETFKYATIVLAEIYMEIQLENPAVQTISIVTDSWQETQPTVKELLTLLMGLESGLKLDE